MILTMSTNDGYDWITHTHLCNGQCKHRLTAPHGLEHASTLGRRGAKVAALLALFTIPISAMLPFTSCSAMLPFALPISAMLPFALPISAMPPFASATSLAGAFLAHSSLSSFYAPPVRSILRPVYAISTCGPVLRPRTGSRERSPKLVEDARPPRKSAVELGCRPVAPASYPSK